MATKPAILATNLSQKSQDHNFICYNCNRHYKDKSGLWRHKKNCINKKEKNYDENNYYEGINIKDKDALVLYLLKQNSDLQKSLIELLNK